MARTGMSAPEEGTSLEREHFRKSRCLRRYGQIRQQSAAISIIAGPCQLESRSHALEVASALKEIAARLKIGLVYKTSFDKANRSSGFAARASGLRSRCRSSPKIRSSLGLPVLTDIHESIQCAEVAQAVDVLQIPAYLCRQTDLLLARRPQAVSTLKKGQFLAPSDMANRRRPDHRRPVIGTCW